MTIAVIIACHNRREKTLRCLRSLREAAAKMPDGFSLDVFLADDGSTDGTGEAVGAEYPAVRIVKGDGNLYWAKGMALAWKTAIDSGVRYDWCLWLNDDVELYEDSLAGAFGKHAADSVVVGKTESAKGSGVKTYGLAGRWFNGNFVLVPRGISDRIGIISDEYSHARADYDYAERVRRAGFGIAETGDFVGSCPDDFAERHSGKTFRERLALLRRPGYWNLRDLWRFQKKYYGVARAACCCGKLAILAMKGVRK